MVAFYLTSMVIRYTYQLYIYIDYLFCVEMMLASLVFFFNLGFTSSKYGVYNIFLVQKENYIIYIYIFYFHKFET